MSAFLFFNIAYGRLPIIKLLKEWSNSCWIIFVGIWIIVLLQGWAPNFEFPSMSTQLKKKPEK